MIVTNGLGSSLLITQGYGAGGVVGELVRIIKSFALAVQRTIEVALER